MTIQISQWGKRAILRQVGRPMYPSQSLAEEPPSLSLPRKRYSEPYKPAEPMVVRSKPTATGCRGAASDFRAFRNRYIRDQARADVGQGLHGDLGVREWTDLWICHSRCVSRPLRVRSPRQQRCQRSRIGAQRVGTLYAHSVG